MSEIDRKVSETLAAAKAKLEEIFFASSDEEEQ